MHDINLISTVQVYANWLQYISASIKIRLTVKHGGVRRSAGGAGKLLWNMNIQNEIGKMFFEDGLTVKEISELLKMDMETIDLILCGIIARETPSGDN